MSTSTNNENIIRAEDYAGGMFADVLTLLRALVTPIIMGLIIWKWPDYKISIAITILFAAAALTDVLDNMLGGPENSRYRTFGWFDDIADTVLFVGTLTALYYVLYKNGLLTWLFGVPAAIIILREIIVGLFKGSNFRQSGWPETKYGPLKTLLIVLATSILVASPWLTTAFDTVRADDGNIIMVYGARSTLVWTIGVLLLWVAAIFSVMTGIELLRIKARHPIDG